MCARVNLYVYAYIYFKRYYRSVQGPRNQESHKEIVLEYREDV